MITPFQLDASWRDYWNTWSPVANAQIAPITDNSCYSPRIRMVPDPTQQIMPASGKIERSPGMHIQRRKKWKSTDSIRSATPISGKA